MIYVHIFKYRKRTIYLCEYMIEYMTYAIYDTTKNVYCEMCVYVNSQ